MWGAWASAMALIISCPRNGSLDGDKVMYLDLLGRE